MDRDPSTLTADADLTGRVLADYQILRRLGQGGMGQVYLAEQISLKRKVALKLLRPELAANPTALQRFKAEAEAVARATHANIVQVYMIGEVSGLHYMALEYVEGRNLRDYVARKGPPEVLLGLSIMRQVAAALQRAAELGIIHRDIKPENILLTRKGEVKVADFGLSRCLDGMGPALNLTQSGTTMGTPLYMSPEQVEGKAIDCRTDIYSFGVTCYHMFTGQPPFRGVSAFEVALQHVKSEPELLAKVRPDLPPDLCGIIHKMMAKNPDDRYQTGRELLKDLVRLRDTLSGLAPMPSLSQQEVSVELLTAAPPTQEAGPAIIQTLSAGVPARRPWLPVAVVASLLLALGGGALFAWHRAQAGAKVAPSGTGNGGSDAGEVEALFSLQKREQTLRDMAEQYLNPAGGYKNVDAGYLVCRDLAVFYLDHQKLDKAEELFNRLDSIPPRTAKPYKVLGHLGQAIVLALRNKPTESNKKFQETANLVVPGVVPGVKPGEKTPQPGAQFFSNLQLRFWIAEALTYNLRNNLPENEVPEFWKRFRNPPGRP
jgi:serine/threonine-protein kinase